MLNGIGGRTIAEAQANLSFPEFMVWVKYRGLRGSFNQGMRTEVAASRVIGLYLQGKTGHQYDIHHFAPHEDGPPPLTIEEAIRTWR